MVVRAVILFLLVVLMVSPTAAQQQITLTSDDLKAGMPPEDVRELSDMMDRLRTMQEKGRSFPKGSDDRQAYLGQFERLKHERDEKFGYIRGISGSTVTVYGEPAPSAAQIAAVIVRGRLGQGGDGIIYPHWVVGPGGSLTGQNEPPEAQVGQGLVPPADTSTLEPGGCDNIVFGLHDCDGAGPGSWID